MGTPQSPRRPVFFWQAVFILLPVVGLGWFGLYSLRQDRLLAEQEARESGKILAQRLAEAISAEGGRQLLEYCEMSRDFELNWETDLNLLIKPLYRQAENAARQRIRAFEQMNDGIDLDALPAARGLMEPQMESLPPQPPEWFLALNPEQQQLWAVVKKNALGKDDSSALQTAAEHFKDAKPPDGAQANLEYLLLLAQTRHLPAAEAAGKLVSSPLRHSPAMSEAGLPIGQLISCRALQLMPDGTALPETFIKFIGREAANNPSMLLPPLIAELQRVTKGTGTESNVIPVKTCWDMGQLGVAIKESFSEQHPTNTWTSAPYWMNSAGGNFLVMLDSTTNGPAESTPPPGCYRYVLLPETVVEQALTASVLKGGISLPPYASVEFEMGRKQIVLSHSGEVATASNFMPLLGEAGGAWETLRQNTNASSFHLYVRLASSQMLYAHQRQRTWLFSGLIVVSTGTAVMGLVAAWRSFRRQRELSELKSNFVSSVSHELRAPIASVRLMAENLEHGKVPEVARQHEYFRFIVQECRRLSSLIENVLDFSRIEQGRKQYEFEPTDLGAMTQMTVKLMEPYAAEKGVRLELAVNGEAGKLELNVDGRAIQQALVNLIDNAIKHSAKGQAVIIKNEKLKIKNGAEPGAAEVVQLSVSDEGPGIAVEEHEKIFERFYRLGSELRRETQGVGIGLSVVKHIVEAHGGRVTVASEPGKGSRFTIELPVTETTCNES